jgi:hypothetical protein
MPSLPSSEFGQGGPNSTPPAIVTQRAIADWCGRSPDPDVAAFGAALRDGLPLAEFGLEFAAWLPNWFKSAAIERRDRAIAELGKLLPREAVERTLATMLAEHKPLADPVLEAKRCEIFRMQAVIYPQQPNAPPSRRTIRSARARYG